MSELRSTLLALIAMALLGCGAGARATLGPGDRSVPTGHVVGVDSVAVRILEVNPIHSRTPLLVFLHGVGGDEGSWERIDGPERLEQGAEWRDGLIVVAVRGDTLGWPETLSGTSWEAFLLEELIPGMRSAYELDERAPVLMAGVSAGAEKALTLAFRHAGAVDCLAVHSPAIHWPDPGMMPGWARGWDGWSREYGSPIDGELWRARNAIDLAATQPPADLWSTNLYFDVGRDDQLGFNETAQALADTLSGRGVPHVFRMDDGGHGNDFYRAQLPEALAFLRTCAETLVWPPEDAAGDARAFQF